MQHMHVESLTVNLWKVSQRSKSTPIFPKVSRILSKQDQSWTDCWSELFFFLACISLKLLASMPYYIITFYFYPFNQLTIKLETEGYNCYHCINLLHKIKLLWRSIFFLSFVTIRVLVKSFDCHKEIKIARFYGQITRRVLITFRGTTKWNSMLFEQQFPLFFVHTANP